MEDSTTNLRHGDDVFSRDNDENKNERNSLEIEEKGEDTEIGLGKRRQNLIQLKL